jgi:hypothetical protein
LSKPSPFSTSPPHSTRAFLFAFGDVAQHVVAVREADQRAEVGAFIEQIARADAAHALDDFLLKRRLEFRGTNTRVPLVQTWPELKKLAIMAMSAARSRSASSKIISGDLPPSSIVTSFSDEAAELAITFCRWRRRR